jgi:predicted phosphodiesterase
VIYGILADIHGNLEALLAALESLRERNVDRLVCLGDIVGYNANSNECVNVVRRAGIASIAGNHDLISIGRLGFGRCANTAAFALKRTREILSPENRDYLATLPPSLTFDERMLMVHGGIDDVQQYVRSREQVQANVEPLRRRHPAVRVCFYGHTHEPAVYEVDGDTVRQCPAQGSLQLESKTYFINPGSVDASRKRAHKLAEYGVFDSSTRLMEFHRVAYDHESVERKAVDGGYRIDRMTDWFYRIRRRLTPALAE